MEDFYFEETSFKDVIKKLFIGLLIVACFVLLFMYIKNRNELVIKKTIKVEAGTVLSKDLSFYVKSNIKDKKEYEVVVDGYDLGDTLDTAKEINYKVVHKNQIKKGKIIVRDTKAPIVTTEDLTIGVDEDYDLDSFITTCEDYSKPCTVTAKNENDEELNSKVGEHTVTLIIADQLGNKVNKKVKLIVKEGYSLEEERTSDLKYVKVEPSYDDFTEDDILIKLDKAFNPDALDDEGYEFLYDTIEEDLTKYLPSKYSNSRIISQEIIYLYNRYGYITSFAVRVLLSSGDYTYLVK